MTRASVVFLVWALLLAALAVVQWTVFTHGVPNYYLLVVEPAFAVGGTITFAVVAAAASRRSGAVIATPDLSLPSALIGVAVALMLWGSFIGEWLLLIGAGLLVLGAGGLMRELVFGRRLKERS